MYTYICICIYIYIARTSEVEVRAAAAENAYAQMHREPLEQRNQLQENLQEAQHQRVLASESGTASRQIIQRERAIHQRNLAEQAERWRAHSMEIFDEGRAAVSTQRQEVNQLQEHLAETQAQVDDWSFWYGQEYGSEYEMVQEDQEDEQEAAEVNQVQQVAPATGQLRSTPLTPPVVQGHVPAELHLLHKFPLLWHHSL